MAEATSWSDLMQLQSSAHLYFLEGQATLVAARGCWGGDRDGTCWWEHSLTCASPALTPSPKDCSWFLVTIYDQPISVFFHRGISLNLELSERRKKNYVVHVFFDHNLDCQKADFCWIFTLYVAKCAFQAYLWFYYAVIVKNLWKICHTFCQIVILSKRSEEFIWEFSFSCISSE